MFRIFAGQYGGFRQQRPLQNQYYYQQRQQQQYRPAPAYQQTYQRRTYQVPSSYSYRYTSSHSSYTTPGGRRKRSLHRIKRIGLKYNVTSGDIILKLVPVLRSLNATMEYIIERGDRAFFRVEHIAGTMILRAKPGLTVGQIHKVWLKPKSLVKPQKTKPKMKKNISTNNKPSHKERAKKAARIIGMREAMRFSLHLQIEVI